MTLTLMEVAQRVETLEKQMAVLMKDTSDTKEKPDKKDKKAKKGKNDPHDDEPKKKKNPSGYLVFSKAMREDVKQELENKNGEKPKSTEVMKELGAAWKALSDDEREGWNDKAKQVNDDA